MVIPNLTFQSKQYHTQWRHVFNAGEWGAGSSPINLQVLGVKRSRKCGLPTEPQDHRLAFASHVSSGRSIY